ncbi:T9SS type A sorting domain-containing protein [candidate division KSB1 bacterium]|nr:T9SS type A sorting domain-containing protein [candidate division KSB1 bacterium]
MTYQYRLSDVDTQGNVTILDALEITMEIQNPEETQLEPPFPNPFNPQTKIVYKLAQQSSVTLNVYDVNGRLVSRMLQNVQQSAGSYSIHWLGKDDAGRQAASGTYILRLIAGDVVKSQKVLLMR